MKYVEQTGGHCMVASVCMVLNLNYAFYEGRVPASPTRTAVLGAWKGKRARAYATEIERAIKEPMPRGLRTAEFRERIAEGRGVIVVDGDKWKEMHAVAYEDGLIYDPAPMFKNGRILFPDQFRLFLRRRKGFILNIIPV